MIKINPQQVIYGVVGKTIKLKDVLPYQRKGFITNQSDLVKYNGQKFVIVRALAENEIDLEVAPMFKIRFSDGLITDAFMDEIFEESFFTELVKEENLVRGGNENGVNELKLFHSQMEGFIGSTHEFVVAQNEEQAGNILYDMYGGKNGSYRRDQIYVGEVSVEGYVIQVAPKSNS